MKRNRRDFIKVAGLTGVGMVGGLPTGFAFEPKSDALGNMALGLLL